MNTSIIIQNFWNEFIDLYRDLPALWKKRSDEYKDKQVKQRSYLILTKKLREILPDATVASTKKKINSLRSNYRKEVRKIEDSINMGAAEDQLYTPRSWYFKKMTFLESENNDKTREARTEKDENEDSLIVLPEDYEYFEAVDDDEMSSTSKPMSEDHKPVNKTKFKYDDPLVRTPSPTSSNISTKQKVHLKIERVESVPTQSEIHPHDVDLEKDQVSCSQVPVQPPAKRMRISTNDSESDDECEILARAWKVEYKKLDAEQQLFASKAISDILFEGRLRKLSYHSVKVNQQCDCKCPSKHDEINN